MEKWEKARLIFNNSKVITAAEIEGYNTLKN
jgi:hypothetical protein